METYVIDFEASNVISKIAIPYQLAALKYDDDINKWSIERWYFAVDREVPQWIQVNCHLTKDKLNVLSRGLTFAEQYDSMKHIWRSGNVLIGHNIQQYDYPLLINILSREGLPNVGAVGKIDTMLNCRYYKFLKKKGTRISKDNAFIDLCDSIDISVKDMQKLIMQNLNKMGIGPEECHTHNACYDVYVEALLHLFGNKDVPKNR